MTPIRYQGVLYLQPEGLVDQTGTVVLSKEDILGTLQAPVIGECEECGHQIVTPLKRHSGPEEKR